MNIIRIDGDVAYIELKNGIEAIIDYKDIGLIINNKWVASGNKYIYAKSLIKVNTGYKSLLMHRLIANAKYGLCIDHINGNCLDNRRINLRHATIAQNTCNQKIRKTNTTGIKGVYFEKSSQKWRAQIKFNYKKKTLGRFENIDDAKKAYAIASMNFHGEFGRV